MTQEVETQTQPEEATGPTFEAGSEDDAVNALNKRDAEANQDPETPEDEPESEADEEPSDGEPDEAETEEELAEVEYEGKTYKVPPELEKAVLRQADYSRKMNEVSAKEKDYTQRLEQIETLDQTVEKRVEVMAEIKSLDERIKAYEGIDWAKAKVETPGEAAMAAVELMELKQARQHADDKSKSIESEFSQGRFKLLNEKRADMVKVLAKDLPGWGEELGTKITQHAISKGWTAEELQTLTNPRVVMALDAERKYELAQKGKAELKAKVKDVPQVVKPGAKRPIVPQSKTAMDRFKHTKSDEDAIAALESRTKR